MNTLSKNQNRLFTICALILSCSWLIACSQEEQPEAQIKTATSLVVKHFNVEPTQVTNDLIVSGNIAPWEEANISTRLSGLAITKILVDVGTTVEAGQVIATLDDRYLQLSLDELQAQLRRAQANLAEASANRKRTQSLFAKKLASDHELLTTQTAEAAAQANLDITVSQINSLQTQLQDTKIQAPDAGTISAKNIALGDVVSPQQSLFKLIRQDRLEWRAELLDEQLTQINIGQSVEINGPTGAATQGTVRALSPSLNTQTRLAIAYVDIPTESELIAGGYHKGRINLGNKTALLLPLSSVAFRDGRTSVFEITPQNTVIQHFVRLGQQHGERFEALSGVSPGQRLVLDGANFLADGDNITLAQETGK